MEHRRRKLYVAEVARAFSHVLVASRALEGTIDRAKTRIIQALFPRSLLLLILLSSFSISIMGPKVQRNAQDRTYHCLRILDMSYAHILDLLWREKSKLDFLNGAQRRA